MSTLSSTMMNAAQSVDKDISSLTESSIKLRKTLLDLQLKVTVVDSYTQSGAEEQWKAIRSDYDALLYSLNETAKLCGDTIGDYVVLLPEISNPDMFEDARIELKALVEKLQEDNSKRDLSENFKQLGDTIAQFVNEIDTAITRKDQDVNFTLKEAEEQVSKAQARVERLRRLQEEEYEKESRGAHVYQFLSHSVHGSSKELSDAEKRLKTAHQEMAQADAQMHAQQKTNWPRLRTSLGNAKTQLERVASEHLVIDQARKILTDEVEGHLGAFDQFVLENTPASQLAVSNYNRKALDDEPKFVSIQNSLEKFAFEFK